MILDPDRIKLFSFVREIVCPQIITIRRIKRNYYNKCDIHIIKLN